MRKKIEIRIIILVAVFFLMFVGLCFNYYRIAMKREHVRTARTNAQFTVTAGISEGTIYDRNLKPIVNSGKKNIAVAVPAFLDRNSTAEYAVDKDDFLENFDKGLPFTFECKPNTSDSDGLTVFEIPERYSENQPAQHVVGYLSQGEGVAGIEYAYDKILRSDYGENSVTYTTDGFGQILIGDGKKIIRSNAEKSGAVTTIDLDIQKICEDAGKDIDKGAIVVADVKTGEILAMASFPDYNVADMEKALSDERSPLINRALYSYSVGSVFKLVTSAQAIENKYGGYVYNCTGQENVEGKIFNCHKADGHGLQTLSDAITNSCNTYFINLSRVLDVKDFRELAFNLGFGREIHLCSGMTASGGVLPTVKELMIPAELANFSFGQGKLSATPLQILQLTCAIANDGKMPVLRIVKGMTLDGEDIMNEKTPQHSEVLEKDTANQLKEMMISAVEDNENSNARTIYTTVGAKTSTAQTGRTDKKGEELCHAWITGFFPADKPQYAVTVLVEDGGYGNDVSAPVFREIADRISQET
ncbi:MAG: penicillin-binding protein 2 [Ruminococcus flavefaciens]|nr:penicillin-binding protein 2 [Ruminococcus flavefaciens]